MIDGLNTQVNIYIAELQEEKNKHFAENYNNLTPPVYTMDIGRRYIRIVENGTGNSTSKNVHSFIDSTNGDVLKAASWKAPAKHPRGNVFSEKNGAEGRSVWGANYR